MNFPDINWFIKSRILQRGESLFQKDIFDNQEQLHDSIHGKSVLVIGGAGTIGSSFIKAVLKYEPESLFVIDTNENGLTELTRDLRSIPKQYVPVTYLTYPMNFGDEVFKKMFLRKGPFDIVANFAAHKHVRSEKDIFSIEAMLYNNVFRAKALLDLLSEYPPQHFFCVSTDKAANPVNVMGASKKLMEETIMAYSNTFKITTARFANVAFSNGSLLDGYIHRLMKKQPVSCPSDVKRFFVSPEESGQICMLACILGKSGDIFFPKLEEHDLINFKYITESFFEAMGTSIAYCESEEEAKEKASVYQSGRPYPVYFFDTDTSGEKLFEEFYTDSDEVDMDSYTALGVVKNAPKPLKQTVEQTISDLQNFLDNGSADKAAIVGLLKHFLPGFEHIETGKNLDQKM